jgi:predicted Zn-dependent peptidase
MATTITRQNSTFYTETLPNGLQMLGQKIPGVQSAASVFYVNTGTRDERVEDMGVSHFLEHMAFKRTAHYSGEEIDRRFEELGAEHNAGTWKEMTFYWARVLGENAPGAIDLLAELTHPMLGSDDFDAERPVILEEIARYEDMPSHLLLDYFMHDYFGSHPLAWETLGTPETIQAMSVEQMRSYWEQRYGTRNIIFAIAGNFDWDSTVAQVQQISQDWVEGEAGRAPLPAEFRPGFRVYQSDKFVQEQIAIGVPSVPSADPRYYSAAVLSVILGDDTGSRLFWSLYQPGLAESATAQVFDFDDNGLFWVHIGTEPGLAQAALDRTLDELARLQAFDVEEGELDRAKAKLNSSVIIGGESTNERVMGLINSWLSHGRLETLEEIRRKIEEVSLEDLRNYVRDYPLSPRQVITAVGPLAGESLSKRGE